MSAAADKARYYLEQSVPELKELERKKIFATEEITAIAKKRSEFEHKINARGSRPTDYAQYAEFEINVDSLRKKRVKRLGVKAVIHSGQRRILFVFDRGTRKFPGDIQLWMQSIEYARSQKALKKVTQMLTNLLRLHPAKPELWIYAAQFALGENGDMTEARGYMRRGLRFCKNNKMLWLQNFRIELNWIVKIHIRRRLLGIEQQAAKEEVIKTLDAYNEVLTLPEPDDEQLELETTGDQIDVTALAKLDSLSISNGAIPIAVFDTAMQQFPNNSQLAFKFYEEIRHFQHEEIEAIRLIGSHIDQFIREADSTSWYSVACDLSMSLMALKVSDPAFPGAIRGLLSRLNQGLAECTQAQELARWSQTLLEELLKEDLDPALDKVLRSKCQALALRG